MTPRNRLLAMATSGWLVALCLLLTPAIHADQLFLNDGKIVDGKIVSEDGAEVHIVVGGSEIVITKDRIGRIARVADEEVGPGEAAATASRTLLRDKKPLEAWQSVLRMDELEPEAWKRHNAHVQTVVKELLDSLDAAISGGRTDTATTIIETLGGAPSMALLTKVYPDKTSSIQTRLRLARGNTQAAVGHAARQQNDLESAEKAFRAALEHLQSTDVTFAQTQFELGSVLRDRGLKSAQAGNLQEAESLFATSIQAFDQVVQTSQRDAATVQRATREMGIIREQYLNPLRAQLKITPSPVPVVAPVRTPIPLPTPVPTPTPAPTMTEKVFGADFKAKVVGFFNRILPSSVDGSKVADWIIYIVAFVIGFWFVPWIILRTLSKRTDIVADQWLKRVGYAGPIALLGYLVSYIKLPAKKEKVRKAKHPCPHCGFSLDNALLYENLDFSHCPNCGGEIKALYTIDDYIKLLSSNLATDAEKVVMGAVSMEAFVGKDMMQKLVRSFVAKSIRNRASDIHVEPAQDNVIVRYRVDGMMLEMAKLPASLGPAVVSAIKVAANMDISEKRKPQDGRTSFNVDGADIDIRVASSPSPIGEKLSMRLLDFRALDMDPKKLGMTKSSRELFDRVIREPHGLVLVCGPTGSGKTTTLYIALRILAVGDKNIVSIEDPIEFRLQGINQTQVNPAAGLTFANGLRSILRQDPDVVMVGEIRDKDTAEIAVNAAQTGHLVFSTLHTIDAASSVTRLMDFGIGARQFADALSVVMAQRLIRLVCPDCRAPGKPDVEMMKAIGIPETDIEQYQFMIGKGCETCNNTGFHGRTGLFEMLVPNQKIRSALERGNLTTAELRELAIHNGMRTLREEALVLLRQGMTTAEEVLRVTK